MKKIIVIVSFFVLFLAAKAQPPAGYYDAANGKSGALLKTALYNIIKGHTSVSYSQLWTSFQATDKTAAGKVWDMYSNCTFTFGSDQCGSYSVECDCYNREHSFPASWFSDATPMYSDLFHLVPTDGKVNGMRSNYPFGEVTSPTYTSGNGSKLGPCSYPGYSGVVFEPIDEYKGDFARNVLYMATRYENVIGGWSGCSACSGNSYPALDAWQVNLLLKWNNQDRPSAKEIARNNAVYAIQHNRNPYIDNWAYAVSVWTPGSGIDDKYSDMLNNISVFPNPASEQVTINNLTDNVTNVTISDIVGKVIFSTDKPLQSLEVNINDYAKGFYFVTVTADNNQAKTFKFIKN